MKQVQKKRISLFVRVSGQDMHGTARFLGFLQRGFPFCRVVATPYISSGNKIRKKPNVRPHVMEQAGRATKCISFCYSFHLVLCRNLFFCFWLFFIRFLRGVRLNRGALIHELSPNNMEIEERDFSPFFFSGIAATKAGVSMFTGSWVVAGVSLP